MAYLRPLVTVALLALGTSAYGGYAQLATPPGFGGNPAGWTYAASSANDSVFGRVIHQPNGLKVPVPGTSTTMPASYRLAANAPRIAAAAIFLNPYVRTAVSIATWLGAAAITYNALSGKWEAVEDGEVSTGFEYTFDYSATGWHPSLTTAANARLAYLKNSQASNVTRTLNSCNTETRVCQFSYSAPGMSFNYEETAAIQAAQCPPGSVKTPAGCRLTQTREITTPEEMGEILSPKPMPERVPLELPPGTPLPVDPPVINPEPGPNPQPRPRFVPTGDPVQNPNYDPNAQPSPENQPYIQPGVRVKPSPTPQEPLRVDLEPVNVPKPTPDPTPETDTTEPGTQPKPEDQQSLCEKHPDIVACQKLGELQPETLQTKTVTLTIERSDGFGPSTGTCPAPKTATIMGKQVAFQWDLLCDFASGIRPLLIGFAYLSAALAFMGLTRRGD